MLVSLASEDKMQEKRLAYSPWLRIPHRLPNRLDRLRSVDDRPAQNLEPSLFWIESGHLCGQTRSQGTRSCTTKTSQSPCSNITLQKAFSQKWVQVFSKHQNKFVSVDLKLRPWWAPPGSKPKGTAGWSCGNVWLDT